MKEHTLDNIKGIKDNINNGYLVKRIEQMQCHSSTKYQFYERNINERQ